MWTMKRCIVGGTSESGDWVILYQGRDVGRIRFEEHTFNGALPWTWATWCLPTTHGRVNTMEEAREMVRSEVLRTIQSESR